MVNRLKNISKTARNIERMGRSLKVISVALKDLGAIWNEEKKTEKVELKGFVKCGIT